MVTFRIGNEYSFTDWFTGGQAVYEVVKNDGNMVVFRVKSHEIDGVHVRTERYPINHNTETEYVVLYKYKGHKAIITAEDTIESKDQDVEQWMKKCIKKYS